MSDTETFEILAGTVIFIMIVLFFTFFMYDTMRTFTGGVETHVDDIQAVEAAHIVKSCLSKKSNLDGQISAHILSENNGKSITEICEIQYPPIWASLRGVENGERWSFPITDLLSLSVVLQQEYRQFLERLTEALQIWDNELSRRRTYSSQVIHQHRIWINIVYDGKIVQSDDEIVMKSGERYVLESVGVSNSISRDIIVRIYPEELYKNQESGNQGIDEVSITGESDLDNLRQRIKDGDKLKVSIQIDITSKNLVASGFGLGRKMSDCGSSAFKKLCIVIMGQREVRMGELYVGI